MAYFVQYNKSSGNLIDYSTESFGFNIESEYLEIEEKEGNIPDLIYFKWCPNSKNFVPRNIRTMSKLQFLNRFYPAERIAARNSDNVMVRDILAMLEIAEYINLDDIVTQQAVSYLSVAGILTPERLNEVLT